MNQFHLQVVVYKQNCTKNVYTSTFAHIWYFTILGIAVELLVCFCAITISNTILVASGSIVFPDKEKLCNASYNQTVIMQVIASYFFRIGIYAYLL